jgi:chemotaxis protein methyltransferase CheR
MKLALESRYGLKLDNRKDVLSAIIAERAQSADQDYARYVEQLLSDSHDPEWEGIVEEFLVHETYFFRNPRQFMFFEDVVLGEWFPNQGSPDGFTQKSIRIGSFGCSTGEEPYSIAMSVARNLQESLRNAIRIEAMDLSAAALQKAKSGRYESTHRLIESVSVMNPNYLNRYFTASGGYHTVKEELCNAVVFLQKNMIDLLDVPESLLPKYHCIFCRNLMIYFNLANQNRLIKFLENSLLPGGYLFLGDAEALHIYNHGLNLAEEASALVYRKPNTVTEAYAWN